MVNKELLEILRCPACLSPLLERGEFLCCSDSACRRRYQIIKEIPVLLIEKSEVLEEKMWRDIAERR